MLSKYQFAVLRTLHLHRLSVFHIGKYKDTSIYWLFKRGYLIHNKEYVELTQSGLDALQEYTNAKIPLRKNPSEITERTARYLRVSKMRKSA